MAVVFWVISLVRNDVSIVDSLWSLMFLLVAVVYAVMSGNSGPRGVLVPVLVAVWALRLSVYITWRNHGQPEDYRYQEIRANNEPGFRFKSLYIVFVLQAVLAWIISLPLAAAITGESAIGLLDYVGCALFLIGLYFEAVGDLQLSRFRKDPANAGKVLDNGLWRYTQASQLFWQLYPLVGLLPDCAFCRCLVDHHFPAVDDLPAFKGLRGGVAGKRYRRTQAAIPAIYSSNQCIFPRLTAQLKQEHMNSC